MEEIGPPPQPRRHLASDDRPFLEFAMDHERKSVAALDRLTKWLTALTFGQFKAAVATDDKNLLEIKNQFRECSSTFVNVKGDRTTSFDYDELRNAAAFGIWRTEVENHLERCKTEHVALLQRIERALAVKVDADVSKDVEFRATVEEAKRVTQAPLVQDAKVGRGVSVGGESGRKMSAVIAPLDDPHGGDPKRPTIHVFPDASSEYRGGSNESWPPTLHPRVGVPTVRYEASTFVAPDRSTPQSLSKEYAGGGHEFWTPAESADDSKSRNPTVGFTDDEIRTMLQGIPPALDARDMTSVVVMPMINAVKKPRFRDAVRVMTKEFDELSNEADQYLTTVSAAMETITGENVSQDTKLKFVNGVPQAVLNRLAPMSISFINGARRVNGFVNPADMKNIVSAVLRAAQDESAETKVVAREMHDAEVLLSRLYDAGVDASPDLFFDFLRAFLKVLSRKVRQMPVPQMPVTSAATTSTTTTKKTAAAPTGNTPSSEPESKGFPAKTAANLEKSNVTQREALEAAQAWGVKRDRECTEMQRQLESKLQQIKDENDQLRRDLAKRDETVKTVGGNWDALQKKRDECEQRVGELVVQLEEYEKRERDLGVRLEECENAREELNEQIRKFSVENAMLKREARATPKVDETAIAALEAEITGLRNELVDAKIELEQANAAHDEIISQRDAEIATLKRDAPANPSSGAGGGGGGGGIGVGGGGGIGSRRGRANPATDQENQSYEELQRQVHDLQAQVRQAEERRRELITEADKRVRELKDASLRYDTQRSSHDRQLSELRTELQKLTIESTKDKVACEQREREMTTAQLKAEHEEAMRKCNEEKESLRASLRRLASTQASFQKAVPRYGADQKDDEDVEMMKDIMVGVASKIAAAQREIEAQINGKMDVVSKRQIGVGEDMVRLQTACAAQITKKIEALKVELAKVPRSKREYDPSEQVCFKPSYPEAPSSFILHCWNGGYLRDKVLDALTMARLASSASYKQHVVVVCCEMHHEELEKISEVLIERTVKESVQLGSVDRNKWTYTLRDGLY